MNRFWSKVDKHGPRVGCGNGALDWKDVRPILRRYLDDRFILVSLPSEVHHDS